MIKATITATLMTAAMALPALAEGDAEKGEKVFKKCKACHAVGPDAKNKVGPLLNGIVGAPAGAQADFKYSDALVAMAEDGLVWDQESLSAFLTKPKDFMKGTKMSFAGLRKEAEVENVIAYLETFPAE